MFKTRTEKKVKFTALNYKNIRDLGFIQRTDGKFMGDMTSKNGRTNRKLWLMHKGNSIWRIFEGYNISNRTGNLEEIIEGKVSLEDLTKIMNRLM